MSVIVVGDAAATGANIVASESLFRAAIVSSLFSQIFLFFVGLVLSQADYLKVFNPEQLNAMAMIFIRLANSFGQGLLEIFWTPYFFSFGLLIIRSRFLPKIFGILLMIMSVGFVINVFTKFLIPQFYPAIFTQLAMSLGALGGIPTMLWLLIKGAKAQPLDTQALRANGDLR